MDCTTDYIKMCEKANVTQGRGLVYGDYYHRTNLFRQHVDIFCEKGGLWQGEFIYGFIWLPRQDQLQEMTGITKAWQFHEWIKRISFGIDSPPDVLMRYEQDWSMEQLWLAFVMKEKYNKVWDGEEWKNSQK